MHKLVFLLLLASASHPSIGQTESPGFLRLMEIATVKRIIPVETVAGNANVLLTSLADNPAFLFIFVPGGDGHLRLNAGQEGQPLTARPRNPAYLFAPAFLERKAAWAAIDVAEAFAQTTDIRATRAHRTSALHVEATTQIGRRLREEYPSAKLILVGHSNGAIVAGMQAVQAKPAFDAVVFSAPQLAPLPFGWRAENATVPILFITHRNDDCKGSTAYDTTRAAGRRFPLIVIEAPSPGSSTECFMVPAPHFFTNVYGEYADALLKWAAALKQQNN